MHHWLEWRVLVHWMSDKYAVFTSRSGTVVNRNRLHYDPSVLFSHQFWQTDDRFCRSNWGPGCENLHTCQFFFKGDFMWGHKLAWRSWNYANVSIFRLHVAVSVCINRSGVFFFFLLQTGTPQGTLILSLPMRNRKRLAHDIPQTCATHGGLVHACTRACVRAHTRTPPPPHTHTHACNYVFTHAMGIPQLPNAIDENTLLLFKLTGSGSFCLWFGFAYYPNLFFKTSFLCVLGIFYVFGSYFLDVIPVT